jgi:hypothetical protein
MTQETRYPEKTTTNQDTGPKKTHTHTHNQNLTTCSKSLSKLHHNPSSGKTQQKRNTQLRSPKHYMKENCTTFRAREKHNDKTHNKKN